MFTILNHFLQSKPYVNFACMKRWSPQPVAIHHRDSLDVQNKIRAIVDIIIHRQSISRSRYCLIAFWMDNSRNLILTTSIWLSNSEGNFCFSSTSFLWCGDSFKSGQFLLKFSLSFPLRAINHPFFYKQIALSLYCSNCLSVYLFSSETVTNSNS